MSNKEEIVISSYFLIFKGKKKKNQKNDVVIKVLNQYNKICLHQGEKH